MREIGAFEAKNTLSALLDEVERGEEIVITRRGKPVAKLVRTDGGKNRDRARAAISAVRDLRRELTLGDVSIAELIADGRP